MSFDYNIRVTGNISCIICGIIKNFSIDTSQKIIELESGDFQSNILDHVCKITGFEYCQSCNEPCCNKCITMNNLCFECSEREKNDDKNLEDAED